MDAAAEGDTKAVALLLAQGAHLCYSRGLRDYGCTVLHMAAEAGEVSMVEILLENGANVNATRVDGCTPLWLAAFVGNVAVAKLLLQAGANMEAVPDNCGAPLFVASRQGHVHAVKLLLEWGADANKTTNSGTSPLFVASMNGHAEVVAALVENGANIDHFVGRAEFQHVGVTALFVACQCGHKDVVKVLLTAGADANVVCSPSAAFSLSEPSRNTTYAEMTPLCVASEKGFEGIVSLLLQGGAKIGKAELDLYLAICNDHVEVFKVLVCHAIACKTRIKSGQDHWLCRHLLQTCAQGRAKIVHLLLDQKVNPDCSCHYSDLNSEYNNEDHQQQVRTPLFLAID